jgi:ActR/RegA family two-component response regulator
MINLLLVEDDIVDQKAFLRAMRTGQTRYDYSIAGSVREARSLMQSVRYDVILADYQLGDGTALDIMETLG